MRLTVHLERRGAAALRALADEVCEPGSARYGRYLDRAALSERTCPSADEREALSAHLMGRGLSPEHPDSLRDAWPGDRALIFSTDRARLVDALGEPAARELLTTRRLSPEHARDVLPRALAGAVRGLELGPSGHEEPRDLAPHDVTPIASPASGVAPETIRLGYRFPARGDGHGETIAVMALGGIPRAQDLDGFWRAHGIASPEVRLVTVGPLGPRAHEPLDRFETTMNVQWIGALAPGARIVVYLLDPGATVDPWSAFLGAVLADARHAPTIAVTTWSTPERQYRRAHGSATFARLLDEAAVLGITVIAASGDWGAHGGFPSVRTDDGAICDPLERHATFPGVEARVLSVGGTQVRALDPWREVAWSAPVSAAIAGAVGMKVLAGGGGFSDTVPIPAWQRAVLRSHHPRSHGAPSVAPHGRAQPDVSLMAWGPDFAGRPSSYRALVDGTWRDDAGGTSVAAPIWAAIVARLNEARRREDGPRLGCIAPLLYRIAREEPDALRAIHEGATDLELPGLDADGRRTWFRLPGFLAGEGWSPATGLGVPDVTALERAVSKKRTKKRRERCEPTSTSASTPAARMPPARTTPS